jgi:hypothetical protein
VLLLLDAWNLYYRRPLPAEDIDRELRGAGTEHNSAAAARLRRRKGGPT